MLRKLAVASAFLFLIAAGLGAAETAPGSSSAAEPASEAATFGSPSPFSTSVLDAAPPCEQPRPVPIGFGGPTVCSDVCSHLRCEGREIYSPCGAPSSGRACVPKASCGGGTRPSCDCTIP